LFMVSTNVFDYFQRNTGSAVNPGLK
jgi:hypothetical protein